MKVKTCRTATDTCSRKPILQLLCPLKGSNRNQTNMLILVNRTNHFQHLTKPLQVTSITSFRYLVPPTEGEGEKYCFGADPVGVGVLVVHCLHSVSWTNWWSLTKLAQTHYWEGGKKWLDFGDTDLIFKVIPEKTKKVLSAPYLLKQTTDSDQNSYILSRWYGLKI